MEVRKDILWRVYLCFIGMTLLCVLVLGKAVYIQRVEGASLRQMGDSLYQRIVELDADRGTIYSEDGQMLSTSMPQFRWLTCEKWEDIPRTYRLFLPGPVEILW